MTNTAEGRSFGRARRVLALTGAACVAGVLLPGAAAQAPAPPAAGPAGAPPPATGRATDEGPVRDAAGAVIGFTKTAPIPGTPWRIHDAARPHPAVVTPGAAAGAAPSDAVSLFNGRDLSQWVTERGGQPVKWPVHEGYFEVGPGTGSIVTRDRFGDVQLHLEFAEPSPARGRSQDRGNSGIKFMGLYEVQVLDSYGPDSVTYADGQLGAIYGEYPPLVNAARPPGEWQTYDIMFEAPVFRDGRLIDPAYVTVMLNGVLVQHRRRIMGPTSPTSTSHAYAPHDAELPLLLQDHNHPVRFRNVWIRRLKTDDRQGS
jgi:hypothetical protein